jgi:tetratricopeptide (TPR) repeat protein
MPQTAPSLRYRWVIALGALAALGLGWIWLGRGRHTLPSADAASAYAQGDFPRAAELARASLKNSPNDKESLRVLARSTARMGRHVAANLLFARLGAPALQAEDRFLLGVGLLRAGQVDNAERVWQEALHQDPSHAETIEQLLDRTMARNLVAEAAELAERLARQPGWELKGELRLAALRAEMSDPAGAAALLRRALERPEAGRLDKSAVVRSRVLLARCLLRIGEPGPARDILRRILQEHVRPDASWLLSRAYLQQGAIAEAIAALKAAGSYRADHPLDLEPGPYVGELRCARCHAEQAQAVHLSRHSSTFTRGKALLELPYPDEPIPDPDDPRIIHRFRREGDRVHVGTTAGTDVYHAIVDYAFGSPRQYFSLVGHDEKAKPFIFRLSHFRTDQDSGWIRTTGHTPDLQDTQDSLGKPIDGPDAVSRCLFCHTTDARAALERAGPAANDQAIGCERCHGPGANHVRAVDAKLADLAIVNPAKASAEGRTRVCGQCHANHLGSPLPRTDPFWVRFQATTLTWSRCFTESNGALDCMTCHDPHHDNDRSPAHFNGQCLTCHSTARTKLADTADQSTKLKTDRPASSASCPVNPNGDCINCHMPSMPSKPLHATFTDHYIRVHAPSKTTSSR